MKQIKSFTVDHIKLDRGLYVSRVDKVGDESVTTFDIRMTKPNVMKVLTTGVIHTIEHLGATFLRNDEEYADKIVYFGPMGCRTGFYLILAGEYESKDIVPLMVRMYEFIESFEDEIPGATPECCGNYSDMDKDGAKEQAAIYLKEVLTDISDNNLIYPV